MRLGVLLPTFREGPDDAFAAADAAVEAGLDGVFAYDHLWPMGSPTRPSLAPFPVLSAVARRHSSLVVAPLVARVGLVSTAHLVEEFVTLERLAPGRVIAALGTGDRLSMQETVAYGLRATSADERRALLSDAATQLRSVMPVWIGGGGEATNALARDLGAVINLWDASVENVAALSRTGPVSWAGPESGDLSSSLTSLRDAGATWAVFSPQTNAGNLAKWRATS